VGFRQPAKDYVGRRTAGGKTKTQIMTREVFPHLLQASPRVVRRGDQRGSRAARSAVVAEADLQVGSQRLGELKQLGLVDDDTAEVMRPAYR
jgi:hypothetical protein